MEPERLTIVQFTNVVPNCQQQAWKPYVLSKLRLSMTKTSVSTGKQSISCLFRLQQSNKKYLGSSLRCFLFIIIQVQVPPFSEQPLQFTPYTRFCLRPFLTVGESLWNTSFCSLWNTGFWFTLEHKRCVTLEHTTTQKHGRVNKNRGHFGTQHTWFFGVTLEHTHRHGWGGFKD